MKIGLDIGSTTIKCVVLDQEKIIFKAMDGIVAGVPVDFRRENVNRILV